MTRVRLCFVCLGNICRSPTAEGVFRHLVVRAGLEHALEIDSAGTGGWHVGEAPDTRSAAAAAERGIRVDGAARKFVAADFARFDYVVAMDRSNRENLRKLAPTADARAKISLLRDHDPASPPESDVPDPYYGGPHGFEEVLDLCERACEALLASVRERHGL
ncbi:MAG: low molecular weight phosphotyrosine protein phosphatase [Myxococcales bacterium]|nr:low molecular weight phosphotyrosine protein phosphatase [Myxococcales bacterium]